jgi:hypothetical protein
LGLVLYATCAIALTVLRSAELQRVDENHSVVRYKFAFQWCEGQGDPWWSLNTANVPAVTRAQNSQVCDDESGVTTMTSEERENSTSSKYLRLPYF